MGHSSIQILEHLWDAATLKCHRQHWMGHGAKATRIARDSNIAGQRQKRRGRPRFITYAKRFPFSRCPESCPIAWLQKIFTAIAVRSAHSPEAVPPTIPSWSTPVLPWPRRLWSTRRQGTEEGPSAGTAGTRTGHHPALRSPSSAMTVKDDTSAFLNALQESWEAAERGENDESSRPRPSKTDIAWEVATPYPSPLRHFSTTRRPACSPTPTHPATPFPRVR